MLNIATVSMMRCYGVNRASKKARIEVLLQILESSDAPDLIVCASDYFSSKKHLEEFSNIIKDTGGRSTHIVTTVGSSRKGKEYQKKFSAKYKRNDQVYVIFPDGTYRQLAQQCFSTRENYRVGEAAFINSLENRTFKLPIGEKNLSCSVLSCGEINAFHGRDHVVPIHSEIGKYFNHIDIICNPTHDRMGNDGTLHAKRLYLSRKIGTRHRCYIGVSNWEVGSKSQAKDAETLHSIYSSKFGKGYGRRNETAERQSVEGFDEIFEYRRSTVSF
ncbi:hypothetical protein [Thalassospira sp. TSL5-1]|uniref:hypothetical protein n=1 Tax=Thalassospira sp. TSL5-1 TaxID=1544451 RepID=UPI00093FB383|nr:hypothetical protein [Thalassospira sp. TSL5-1]OKH88916.1 hypothetical protein LF95_02230 [Thalassospira sp. TSL5-1]